MEGTAGLGATFNRGDGASPSESFTALAKVANITGPGLTRSFIDVTHLGSSSGYRDFITGFRDGGTYTLTLNFTHDEYLLLKADFDNDDSVNYQVVLADTDATTLDFAGFVTDLPMTVPFEDKITVDVTIKITGGVTVSS